jgi:bisphosphoglycerate-independent phosphoglycerate mutase (AlkP superfamily)
MANRPKPLLLLILDGFGLGKKHEKGAIALMRPPCWDSLQQNYPMDVVGLPGDQMGNSEAGHLHVGSKPLLAGGNLADPAPTMLAILGVQQATEMTGRSLIG